MTIPIDNTEAFEHLLDQLRAHGFDFTGYKRSTLMRRTRKRMDEVGVTEIEEYADLVRSDPNEFEALFNTILINVTSFFRDPAAWRALEDLVVPELIERSRRSSGVHEPIRIWSAGCATGQEAFSIAMLFAEAIDPAELSQRVKIYATDVDDMALAQARQATYPLKAGEAVPEPLRRKYLERTGGRLAIVPELRRAVIFGRHDLVRDPPISRVGLLLCRNVLMYFTPPLQRSVLDAFHFALRGGGYLCLGTSEMMVRRTGRFRAVELKRRIFSPVLSDTDYYPRRTMTPEQGREGPSIPASVSSALTTRAFELNDIPQIVVDGGRNVALANLRARELFGLADDAVGKPIQDFELSYRPVELRSQIEAAEAEDQPVVTHAALWERGGTRSYWDVTVASLRGRDGTVGTMIAFVDVTAHHGIEEELERLRQEVQSAYGELQSTVEELETTNEELQSTNEELETMNEELQSTNEELETMNDELRQRSTELNEVNFFFESVLVSLEVGVAVTDASFGILVWNREAEKLWGLRAEEVRGQNLVVLDIGLPVAELREPGKRVLSGQSERESFELDAINRLGRPVRTAIQIMPLAHGGQIQGLIILMDGQESPRS